VQSLFHTSDENIKKKYMGAEGGTRVWFSGGNIAPAPAYLSKDVRNIPLPCISSAKFWKRIRNTIANSSLLKTEAMVPALIGTKLN
jgi:hypothetical protein